MITAGRRVGERADAWIFAAEAAGRVRTMRAMVAALLCLRLGTGPYRGLADQPAALFRPVWFLSWLEGRALARTYTRHRSSLPPVPWALAVLFFFVPLAMLVLIAPKPALALIALLVATPFVYARFEG